MIRGIYTSTSGMIVTGLQQDVIANNLANVSTNGFKRDGVRTETFDELLIHRIEAENGAAKKSAIGLLGLGVSPGSVFTEFDQGALTATENPMDFAIEGDGFFAVSTPQGVRFTRNGSLALNERGELVTHEGYQVLSARTRREIVLNKPEHELTHNPGKFEVKRNGEIMVDGVSIDEMLVVDFPKPYSLVKEGNGLYSSPSGLQAATPVTGVVRQGFVESSNVNVIREMVDMIVCQRAYDANQRVILAQDQMLEKAVNEIARLA